MEGGIDYCSAASYARKGNCLSWSQLKAAIRIGLDWIGLVASFFFYSKQATKKIFFAVD